MNYHDWFALYQSCIWSVLYNWLHREIEFLSKASFSLLGFPEGLLLFYEEVFLALFFKVKQQVIF
jgi:hypothetical protein